MLKVTNDFIEHLSDLLKKHSKALKQVPKSYFALALAKVLNNEVIEIVTGKSVHSGLPFDDDKVQKALWGRLHAVDNKVPQILEKLIALNLSN